MLVIKVNEKELYNEETQEFFTTGGFALRLEHSLVALSHWESKWEKPFLGTEEKSTEEILDYIRCMCIDDQVSEEVFHNLSADNLDKINDYINAKMTATWFSDTGVGPSSGETITSELIYYWLVALQIPFEVQTWNLNRLLTLVRVCNVKNSPPKKLSAAELAQRNRELNAQRRAQLGTTG